ncbi:MAG: 23S rRNA (adenine(2503)-C(2))-methyltransferase [Candidatus Magasanikbacteria bacterium RIFOXYC2_FULL_40_16]|uniref:Probable dual-specificity RNA methyltransferase RlmN n=3 Tax=Candidatus Magasanikiibacteriota TaxID=1752731 RepID=A0A1F6NH49_9BACT|nr:MAG: 23S rRNA (adenine(2503)-C(2))-methyltransferase [Candidatus Magasanikbacteria bacterium RIFOXYB1_FULL_40_15]OGH87851.1 MAG: 23S rRNA (adenine(2503)-C(2))-methyltransferase [Candidatus Magasanikbacteria bacterium RIFOXYA1_FULL_40_8]OGH89576.1 MAG: 23S rRNA (adenine(2503)-C(2))-methyltransferase [Candidatus Magasanikbacteria bacterium RIFOXYC2_FULL_40_16]
MNIQNLKLALQNEPKFRYKQAWQAVFKDLIGNWNENTTLPKNLREKLNQTVPLEIKAEVFGSKHSKAIKALLELEDGNKIETVLLQHNDDRNTVCVSSQVGCALGCKFCATGKMGFKRNLTASEIISQVLFFTRYLKQNHPNSRISNIVFMGMGEPFLNYDNVMEAVKIINDPECFNIGARHISISTSGIVEGINKFAKESLQLNLAISLHAPNDQLRAQLMPIDRKYPLEEVMEAVEKYVENKSRQVMFEYLMIENINDGEKEARELAELMRHPLYVVNLIRYNPTGVFKPSPASRMIKFKNTLLRAGVKTTQRQGFGTDINAACGQLAGKKKQNNE